MPLFVSRGPLRSLVGFHRACGPWALDSGGFTAIRTDGHWRTSPQDYAREVRLWQREIGNMEWAAPQDWMNENIILLRSLVYEGVIDGETERFNDNGQNVTCDYLAKKYGDEAQNFKHQSWLRQRVGVHQTRTIDNLISLRELAPEVQWICVLQGSSPEDYISHAEAYGRAGIDLRKEPIVGLGSVCRRKRLDDAVKVIKILAGPKWKLRLHGFETDGFKNKIVAEGLTSADSMAWSLGARLEQVKLCKDGRHKGDCRNCLDYALQWRDSVLNTWRHTMFSENQLVAANPEQLEP